MTTIDRAKLNLKALNSLTKYPSIPTYHQLDPKTGSLTDGGEHEMFVGEVIGTEKVDGTNARIIQLPDGDYLLGSREELLHASGDRIFNPALGIVEHLGRVAYDMEPLGSSFDADTAVVYYVELYGGKIGGQAKNYSTRGEVGWRLFDVATIDNLAERLTWPAERIAGWRESRGQTFADAEQLALEMEDTGLETVPRLFTADASEIPTGIEEMRDFLAEHLPLTRCALDDSAKGAAEGIVLRTPNRSVIAKARFQDYERTLRRRGR